ncbi:hypothetical protein Vadar_014197 [Vaccinium darrowii]|uniref:Uncharacterized protein n=1 Tax=Vaccinium darrowii TaxID=229202 RepID=A0ACB7X0T1_9ERIC|nr:hypothetical protein Vadar_014197 [Vaccinium darrowii]
MRISLGAILRHPDELYPLMKLWMAARHAEKQIPPVPHWAFCYTMLHKLSTSFALVIQQLGPELRDADQRSDFAAEKANGVKLGFPRVRSQGGTKEYKILMDEFHHVSTAFLELERRVMPPLSSVQVETTDDYDEYCHYVAGLLGIGLSRLFHASRKEELAPDSLSNSMGVFLQKTNIIRDYLEDISEIPKPRMFWPRQIWSKYVNKLEELKYEENSVKAVQCLNEMVTNALTHMEDCLMYMLSLRDPAIFRLCAVPQIMAIGTLALSYNNVEVFRGVVKMRRGLAAKVIDRTKTMPDVYRAFYDFSCLLKSKVDKNDPNATITLSRIEAVLKTCRESGTLHKRKSYIFKSEPRYNPTLIFVIFVVITFTFAHLPVGRTTDICMFIWRTISPS